MSTPIRSNLHFRRSPSGRSAFTLIELLVVMGIIGLLGVITAMSFHAIAKDAKLSSGKNALMAVLDNARGLAMKNGQVVMVVFRPRLEGSKNQYMEAVIAGFKGQTAKVNVVGQGFAIVDRFAPLANVPPRAMPAGFKLAGPFFAGDLDSTWIVPSHLPAIDQQNGNGEVPGEMLAVMYGPDGTTITQNSATDSNRVWVDFDDDGKQFIGAAPIDYFTGTPATINLANFNGGYFDQRLENEEPYVTMAPFLALFDDDKLRSTFDESRWNLTQGGSAANRTADYSGYITKYADRIHFNRYTGVIMK